MSLTLPWGPYALNIAGSASGDNIGVTSDGATPPKYTLTIGSNTYDVTSDLNITSGALGNVPIDVTIGSYTYSAIDGRLSSGGGRGTIVRDNDLTNSSNQSWSAGTGQDAGTMGAGGSTY